MTQTVPLEKMPGPTTWQSLLGLRRLRNDVLGLFRQRWREYGDLYLVTLPQRRLVVASHPDLAHAVLVTGRNEYERIERPNGEKLGWRWRWVTVFSPPTARNGRSSVG